MSVAAFGSPSERGASVPRGGDEAGRRRRILVLVLACLSPLALFVALDLAVGDGFPWGGVYWGLAFPFLMVPVLLAVGMAWESTKVRRDHVRRFGRPPRLLERARSHPLGAIAESAGGAVLATGTAVSVREDAIAVVVFGFTAFWVGTALTSSAIRASRRAGGEAAPESSAVWFPAMEPRTGSGVAVAFAAAVLGALAVLLLAQAPRVPDTIAGFALCGGVGLVIATRFSGITRRQGEVAVVPSQGSCSPGEVLTVECPVQSPGPVEPSAGTLTLRAVVRCRAIEGHHEDFVKAEDRTTTQEVLSVPMRSTGSSASGRPRFAAEFVLPDVPPSAVAGTMIGLTWELAVRLRVAHGRDLHGHAALDVRSDRRRAVGEVVSPWTFQPGLRARLRAPDAIPVGSAAVGALELEASVPTVARDVHLVIAREERVVAGGFAHAQEFVVSRQPVTDHADVPAQGSVYLPLNLTVPDDAPPSLVWPDIGEIAWTARVDLSGPSGSFRVAHPLRVVRP